MLKEIMICIILASLRLAWLRTECREHHALDVCPWLCTQTIETVNNSKIILLCNAADRRSPSWQDFSSTSIWYIKQCTTEFSASIIMQCCALKMPPSLHNYETKKAIGKECRAHALSIFGYLNISRETRELYVKIHILQCYSIFKDILIKTCLCLFFRGI